MLTCIADKVIRNICGQFGFYVLLRLKMVERTFTWISRNRQLCKYFGGGTAPTET